MTGLRIDKFLFFTRLAKSRTLAQKIVESGSVRVDGSRIVSPAAPVRPGQVMTLVLHERLRVIRIESLPDRRGPAPEAARAIAELQPPQAIDAARV
jgi:ribosome-associated heat shock protein Hsp15